jgi:hypothetical protein
MKVTPGGEPGKNVKVRQLSNRQVAQTLIDRRLD